MTIRTRLLASLLALSVLRGVAPVTAAIVTAAGYTNDFSTQPLASDFSTRFVGSSGSAGVAEIQTAAALDAAVQTNSSGMITGQCASATGDPPSLSLAAVWASAGRYLQTRPGQGSATLLMATLVN